MNNVIRRVIFVAVCAGISALAASGARADKIGVASVIVNHVQGIAGGNSRALAVGSDLFLNERIRTSDVSTAQLLFLDKTSLTIGPRADLRLDRFVYDPHKSAGRVVINATQGAFRFITGSQNPTSYTIKTPVVTLGIRGTILDILITGNATSGFTLTVVLDQCCAIITLPSGQVLNLTQPGTAYVLTSAGGVTGPVQWEGSIVNAGGGVSFPLCGWYFNGEPPPNGLPPSQIGDIDALNAVIARQLNNLGTQGGGTNAPPPSSFQLQN